MKIAHQIARDSFTITQAQEWANSLALSWHMTARVTRSRFADGSILAIRDNEVFALDPTNWSSVRSFILWLGTPGNGTEQTETDSPLQALQRSISSFEYAELELPAPVFLQPPELAAPKFADA